MTRCLNCNHTIGFVVPSPWDPDAPRGPEPGDFLCCNECGHIQALSWNGFRELTKEEREQFENMRRHKTH